MAPLPASLLYLAGLVAAAGGFAPSIEVPPPTSEPPASSTVDAALLPTFLTHDNATVTVHAGETATLSCYVVRVGDKTVSWVRRKGDDFHILTIGYQKYHNDNRYTLRYEIPNNWKLQIRNTQKRDEGLYACQISTHPPRIMRVFLTVLVPDIEVRDPRGEAVSDAYYRVDSTVGLQCVVMPVPPSRPVLWTREGRPVTTLPQRGIRVDTSPMGSGLSSWLHIARASVSDTGNYTCTAGDTVTAGVRVHVLDGESSAAMQHSTTDEALPATRPAPVLLLLLVAYAALSLT
ncbi:hemicentin-1-like [Scylla paramamosain]